MENFYDYFLCCWCWRQSYKTILIFKKSKLALKSLTVRYLNLDHTNTLVNQLTYLMYFGSIFHKVPQAHQLYYKSIKLLIRATLFSSPTLLIKHFHTSASASHTQYLCTHYCNKTKIRHFDLKNFFKML